MPSTWSGPGAKWKFVLGFAIGLSMPLALGEAFVRAYPPADLHEFLGDDAPHAGIYKFDPVLGADYASYAAFASDNSSRLAELGQFTTTGPTWLFFGNSFVQAPGMLADTARATLPDHRIFNLQRGSERANMRVAQARMLLLNGLKPERIFFALHPNDASSAGRHPLALSWIVVNRHGMITYQLRMPPSPFDSIARRSRLALAAWVRSGRHSPEPSFRLGDVTSKISPLVMDDLRRIIGELGTVSRRFTVPVTIILIPTNGQIFGRSGYAFQDAVTDLSRQTGIDVFDPRDTFRNYANKPELFVPDWHFSPAGNRLLVTALIQHLRQIGAAVSPINKSAL